MAAQAEVIHEQFTNAFTTDADSYADTEVTNIGAAVATDATN
ncbi:PE domain-containing protein [Mycobacterium uberis]